MSSKIFLKDKDRFYALNSDDILYFIIVKRKTTIFCKENIFKIRLSLSEIEKKLSSNFLRTHKSCIINLNNIIFYDHKKKKATLSNGDNIDCISNENSEKIVKYFNDKLKI